MRYRVEQLKRNSISPRTHVLFLYLVERKVLWSVLYLTYWCVCLVFTLYFFSPYIVLNNIMFVGNTMSVIIYLGIENLPFELQRNFTLMRELDQRTQGTAVNSFKS